jgi:hypothetical protein
MSGFAVIAISPNIFTADAKRLGTLSTHAENVRDVIINGVGLRACLAANGLCTEIGMLITDNGKLITDDGFCMMKFRELFNLFYTIYK